MSRFTLKYFRCNVVGCSADGTLFLSIEVKLGSQSEVAELDLHLVVDEQVAEFEVTMNNSVGVQVFECVDNLHGVALHFELVQSLPPPQ